MENNEKVQNDEVVTPAEEAAEKKEEPCERGKKCDKKENAQKEKLEKLEKELAELNDKYLRLAAEYDNYRRRSEKEKREAYTDGLDDTLAKFLPVMDNLSRAALYSDAEKVAEGLKLTEKSAADSLTAIGVERFGAVGDTFDPNLHNAVMHVEDEEKGEGEIVALHAEGYKKGDRILRYAMVTVAN